MSDYADWSRSKLIHHIEAYGHGLHELANTAMKQEHELRRLRARVESLDGFRRWLHGRAP